MTKGHFEAIIEAERRSIKQMRDNLVQSRKLAVRMERSLQVVTEHFEQMEESLQPFFKGMRTAITGENCLESIGKVINSLNEWQTLIETSGSLIKAGPNEAQLDSYCDNLYQIKEARRQLSALGLGHCRVVADGLASLETEGVDRLGGLFGEMLQRCSEPIDLVVASQTGIKPELPDEQLMTKLVKVANFLSDTEKPTRLYVDVRGKYLALCLQPLLTLSGSEQMTSYQRGSHLLIIGLRGLRDCLAPIEQALCQQLLPGAVGLFEKSLKPAVTILQGHLTMVGRECGAACDGDRHRFLEFIYLLDALEEMYQIGQTNPELGSSLQPCFGILLDTCKQWFEKLKSVVGKYQFVIPENASIYEGTALTMNVLKRLADYEGIAEAVLNSMDDTRSIKSSASSASFINPDSVMAISFYVKELLELAEANFIRASKLYSRALKTDIFLLNNYNYMARVIKNSDKLSTSVPVGIENRFEEQIKQVFAVLTEAWTRLGNVLTDPKLAPKDTYKMFSSDLMEQLNIGGQIAVPDEDCRSMLRGHLQRTILPVLQAFHNQNQALFVATGSRSARLDPDTIAAMLSRVFEG